MPACEMCGKSGELQTVVIDGAELVVCSSCSVYGTVKKPVGSLRSRFSHHPFSSSRRMSELPQFHVVQNLSMLLRTARTKRGMTQEEFAHFLNEKSSSVSKWETGELVPSIDTARKLERVLSLSLVEHDETAQVVPLAQQASRELTLGDFVKVRKRK